MLLVAINGDCAPPQAVASEYLATEHAGFVISDVVRDPGKLKVEIVLAWTRRPPSGAFLVAEFSNWKLAERAAVVERAVDESDRKLRLESPSYRCVVNNSTYVVRVYVYADRAKSKLLGTHEQPIEASFDPRALEAFKIKDCGV